MKIKQSLIAVFLNTGTFAVPSFVRMGKGIIDNTIAYGPSKTSEQYIDADTASTYVDGYTVSIARKQTAWSDEACFAFLDGVSRQQVTDWCSVTKKTSSELLAEIPQVRYGAGHRLGQTTVSRVAQESLLD